MTKIQRTQGTKRSCTTWVARALLRKNSAFWIIMATVLLYGALMPSYLNNYYDIERTVNDNIVTKQITKKPNQIDSSGKETEGLAACLLIMDDNHFLVEWIAYHYHTANLRNLVIAVDPKSRTSPLEILGRWKDKINITVWTSDDDYATPAEFKQAKQHVNVTFKETTPSLVDHRARQRIFYTKCLRSVKQDAERSRSKSAWTMMVDVDEFVRVNYRDQGTNASIPPIDQPGSVMSALNLLALPANGTAEPKWKELRQSPCVPLPRVRFLSKIESSHQDKGSPLFLTQSYTTHRYFTDLKNNKISKVVMDLARIPSDDIAPVDSIHLPIRKYCSRRNRYFSPKESLLVANHYTGSFEQFTYRENDARNQIVQDGGVEKTKVNVRDETRFQEQQKSNRQLPTDDEIQPWLSGFQQQKEQYHEVTDIDLLKGSGRLAPKSWRDFRTRYSDDDRCALLFFGLPRSYKELVLPSIVKNVLTPNAHHGCDVFVHYFQQETEAPGRFNEGGTAHTEDVLLLENAVNSVYKEFVNKEYTGKSNPVFQAPVVTFVHDTPEDFNVRYSKLLEKYHTATTTYDGEKVVHPKDKRTIANKGDTVKKYYPWQAWGWKEEKSILDNMIKQWHSIQSVFQLMDSSAKERNVKYTRVGMFRSDALYVTPIDIASLGTSPKSTTVRYDVNNNHFVVPNFALFPVNDRLVYGPYEAVKIWATQRFDLVEPRAETQVHPGKILHSESFLAETVFPAMEKLGYKRVANGDICFLRTRTKGQTLLNDCSKESQMKSDVWGAFETPNVEQTRLSSVSALVGMSCKLGGTRRNRVVSCV